jgi:hypothetical protein
VILPHLQVVVCAIVKHALDLVAVVVNYKHNRVQ